MQILGQGLVQRAELRMGQQQLQSLDVLAMPTQELREKITAELEENPALELASDMRPLRPLSRTTAPYEVSIPYRRGGMEASDAFQSFLESIPAVQSQTLQNHLLSQLRLVSLDSITASYAERIVQNLDSDGFYGVPLRSLFSAELSASGTYNRRSISRALSAVRRLEPIGCAVKDFKQSLYVQAELLFRQKKKIDPIYGYTIDILKHHFSYLEKARPYSLVQAINADPSIPYKITLENAEDIFTLIASLHPFPGRVFSSVSPSVAPSEYIIPAAFVEQRDGEFIVKMNEYELPLLTVSPAFKNLLQNADDAATKTYIKNHVQKANVFIGSLNQREKTILAVLKTIVSMQEAFFITGDKHRLVPLTQQNVAELLGVHESTVSRTVAGKYVQCRWGLFEIKYFFTNALPVQPAHPAGDDQPYTKESAKEYIKELLAVQTGKLSDQKIADMLHEKYGISIARRTVAKYRKELNIAASYDR